MKKLLVLLIIFTLFLSGCSLYNLNSFILPDDTEFLALVQELDTPRKICQYMSDIFESEIHLSYDLTPYQLFITQKGDCKDMSDFAKFIANYHGYDTYQILILYNDILTTHMITVYKENNKYNFSDNQYYLSTGNTDFISIVNADTLLFQSDKIWSSYIVYNYYNNVIEKGINN